MTALPLLYTYRRCPFAMRARMALLQASIAFDAVEIVLRQKPPDLLAVSPKGTVPVLVLPNGLVIEQSLDIMRWASEARDQARSDARSEASFEARSEKTAAQDGWSASQTSDNLALVALNDGLFKHHLDRYKYPEKFVSDSDDAHRAMPSHLHRDHAMQSFLRPLEQRLAAQPYLGGIQSCAADVAIFPFVRQFRAVDEAWFEAQDLPATQHWLQRWLTLNLFALCMKKLPSNERVSF